MKFFYFLCIRYIKTNFNFKGIKLFAVLLKIPFRKYLVFLSSPLEDTFFYHRSQYELSCTKIKKEKKVNE